jgi:FkbM family methyltransferase
MYSEKLEKMKIDKSIVKYKGETVVFNYRYYGKSLDTCIKNGMFYELDMLEFIKDRYGEGGNYIDIGAYCGTHTLFFSKICKANKVYSFEPDHVGYFLLSKNINENNLNNVISYNCGLGDRQFTGIVNEESRIIEKKEGNVCHIHRLDYILHNIKDIKFIKIDIEGMEINALKGMTEILENNKPAFAIECHTTEHFSVIESFLKKYNYKEVAVFNATPTYIF